MTVLTHGVVPLVGLISETLMIGIVATLGLALGAVFVLRKRRLNTRMKSATPPRSNPALRPFTEQRRTPRHLVTPVIVRITDPLIKADPIEGLVLNCSPDGLGLSLKQQLTVGKIMQVRVATAPPTTPWVEVEVKQCTPLASRWRVGFQFVQPPPQEVLMLFG